MRLIRSIDTTLRQFVLGELGERPRLELEERLITDPAAFESLGIVEEELAEAYVEKSLTPSETERFEREYLVDADRRRHVQFIRLLRASASKARRGADEPSGRRMADFVRIYPAWAGAAAAVLLLLAGGNLWFGMSMIRLHTEAVQVRADRGRDSALLQRLESELAGLRSQAKQLQNRIDSLQDGSGQMPTFALTAGLLRSAGNFTRVTVPRGVSVVRLQLQLLERQPAPYRAGLSDDAGNEIWSQARLTAQTVSDQPTIVVLVPAELLTPGDYQLRLSRSASRRDLDAFATYVFRVTR